MAKLLDIAPKSWCSYLFLALAIPFVVRFFICWVESKRLAVPFCNIFTGCGGKEYDNDIPADYWLGFIIGILEMLAYPPLIVTGDTDIIGGWLLFKTLNRWKYAPNLSRGLFNRYLVANAVVLVGAYFSARFAFCQ